MPVAPEAGNPAAKRIAEIQAEAMTQVLRVLANAVLREVDPPLWATRKANQLGASLEDVRAYLAEAYEQASAAQAEAIVEAYTRGATSAEADIAAVRLGSGFGGAAAGLPAQAAIEALVAEEVTAAATNLAATRVRALSVVSGVYRDAVASSTAQVLTGTTTRLQAAQKTLDDLAAKGITGFVDSRGRSWDLATYTEAATRRAVTAAAVNGHTEQSLRRGYDLNIISNSPEECEKCRPWEGKIISLDGSTPGYPTLADAKNAGVWHPGCTHSKGVYFKGLTKIPTRTANPQGYRERQEQRRLERRVRAAKNAEAVAMTEDAAREARVKVKAAQAAAKDHATATDQPRRYERERTTGAR